MAQKKGSNPYQDDSIKSYFDQIKKTPLLTFEEEQELSKRIQKGDELARKKLIEANLRLVVKIAKGFTTGDTSLLDLIQEGNLGLLKAATKFDHRKNVRFSTYASWWIKQSISRALANKRRPIRLPHRKEDALRRIQRAFTTLSQRYMRKPSVEEVSEEVGLSRDDVIEILTISNSLMSLDCEINEDASTLHDVFEDYSYAPDAAVMRKALQEETMDVLNRLRDREKRVIMYRYAVAGGRRYTLKRISDEMGISPETVRQIEMRALRKLRERAGELRGYVPA
jgi:RNA polymerase primary sigma factor